MEFRELRREPVADWRRGVALPVRRWRECPGESSLAGLKVDRDRMTVMHYDVTMAKCGVTVGSPAC